MKSIKTTTCLVAFLVATICMTSAEFCWKNSYGRGLGILPQDCGSGNDGEAGICYPQCKSGYKGVGLVCWGRCPDDWTDNGVSCIKPAPYGRGAGYAWQFGDSLNATGMFRRCEADHGSGNCEKLGLIVYPKCKSTSYHNFGCSPGCPAGYPDTGATCLKPYYDRIGWIPTACTDGKEYDAGLCYPHCTSSYYNVGPVCWGTCPAGMTDCGAACGSSSANCVNTAKDQVVSVMEVVAIAVEMVATGGSTAATKTAAQISVQNAFHKLAKNLVIYNFKQEIKELAKEAGQYIDDNAYFDAIANLAHAKDFDWTVLNPTGIAAIVQAFNKSICN